MPATATASKTMKSKFGAEPGPEAGGPSEVTGGRVAGANACGLVPGCSPCEIIPFELAFFEGGSEARRSEERRGGGL